MEYSDLLHFTQINKINMHKLSSHFIYIHNITFQLSTVSFFIFSYGFYFFIYVQTHKHTFTLTHTAIQKQTLTHPHIFVANSILIVAQNKYEIY